MPLSLLNNVMSMVPLLRSIDLNKASNLTVKNLLTVLSSRVGGLGSTWPAAAEDEVTDKRAEETRSD